MVNESLPIAWYSSCASSPFKYVSINERWSADTRESSMEVVSSSQGALGPLLGKLTALLSDEYGRLKGVRHEIRSLRSELISMHAAIQRYTMLEDPDVQVKTWILLLRELAYDAEDCMDKFIHHLDRGEQHGGIKEFFCRTARSLKTLGFRHRIANQIDELKLRVKEVKELKVSYKLDDVACNTLPPCYFDNVCSTFGLGTVDTRLPALFTEEAHLVGIDGPRDDLAKWMMEGENNLFKHRRVLSIIGFGGLGKTTLANAVYRKIKEHFCCHAFVSVSQKPNMKKIIKDVISQVSCQDEFTNGMDIWEEKKSIEKLRELLQDKRYLIIIDDIWSTPVWNAIMCAFPENNCSSGIIATTRIVGVARSCCPGDSNYIYEMEPLNDIHSKRLFFKRIFGSEDYCPEMLKEVSNEILMKCGGLPLAIISISGLLANKPAVKEEWEKLKRSIGSLLDKNKSMEAMNSILSLSYSDLPSYLKTCLLYLSNFPEDYIIERERLVRRWIAEGFISEERGQSRQEVAENYLYELINKSMVHPVDIGYDGKVRACRVHDMMLELIIIKSIEENFITVVSGGQTVWENSHGYIRRLSIQHIDQELASVLANKDLRHVRSLTVTSSSCIKHLPGLVEFETLRVLDFESCESLEEYDMNGMDNLFHLKYLSFRGTGISELPSGIVRLHDLETLDLRNTRIHELPSGIVELIKLQNLLMARDNLGELEGKTKIPDGVGNLRNLQVTSGFNISMSSVGAVEELGYLTSLRHLHVELNGGGSYEYKRHEEMLLSSLGKLGACKLQSLCISSDDSTPLELLYSWSPSKSSLQSFWMTTSYYLPKIPKWVALTNLLYLNINLTRVTVEMIRMLEKLHALLSLHLWLKSDPTENLAVQGFPNLKEFVLVCGTYNGGAYVTFMQGAMPKVEKLRLPFHVSMARTYGFYFGIGHLPYLKIAIIRLYNKGAIYSDTKAAVAAIRNEAVVHPNHPRVTIWGEEQRMEGNDTDGN